MPYSGSASAKTEYSVSSPDGSVTIRVQLNDRIYYGLEVDGNLVIWYSPISMSTDRGILGENPVIVNSEIESVDQTIETVWGIRSEVKDEYNELRLDFRGDYSLLFRAYDDGIAYRFVTSLKGDLTVNWEQVEYRFGENREMVNHLVDSYVPANYEELYTRQRLRDVGRGELVCLPSIVVADNLKLAIVESDVFEYPGMYLSRRGRIDEYGIGGTFANYPLSEEPGGDNLYLSPITSRADYIARTTGTRAFPWRAVVIARKDTDLADSDLVYKLARPAKIETGWIRPGKVAWDWWSDWTLQGVDFESGVNTRTYEYFIDFAARNNIEYFLLDADWSDRYNQFLFHPEVDMEHVTDYAREKGVGLILWLLASTVDKQYEESFEMFEEWGIAGVKIDFIDRDDQKAIDFYEKIGKEAARHHLMVDYHGCSKPTGLHRTYPNVLNFEGVRGNEYNKFSTDETPGHNVDLVFTRMLAGPMDYTPGAMRNSIEGDFHTSMTNPVSYGTRCHQLGMYVLYLGPLQMLCDSPTEYEKYPDILDFLSRVPVTWDDTHVISGKLGEYVVIARRSGEDWYIGGLTNWTEREVEIDLSEFTNGNYKAEIFTDGINANKYAEDYSYEVKEVSASDVLRIRMKKGGGFAVILGKK